MSIVISNKEWIKFYKILKTIHDVKDSIKSLVSNKEIEGFKSISYGEEAVAAGICSILQKTDIIMNTFDGISNLIAKGGSLNNIIAELFGKVGGYNKGIRGNMNITVPEIGIYSGNSLSDTGSAIGLGFALASKIKKDKKVVVVFYSNESANEGIIHECMNIASAFNLPILFVCKNAVNSYSKELLKSGEFSKRAVGYGIKGLTVNGMDISSIYNATQKIISNIRENNRPAILECLIQHYYYDFESRKSGNKSELDGFNLRHNNILNNFQNNCLERNLISKEEMKNEDKIIKKTLEDAIKFARADKELSEEHLEEFVYKSKYQGIPKMGWSL